MESKRRIGYVGLGLMGGAMSRRLLEVGYPLTVYDARPEAIEPLIARGAQPAGSPREVAAASDLVITSLPTPAVVEAVALGPDGIIHGLRPGMIYIDMSTVDPQTTRRVGAEVERRGAHMLDVPVGPGPDAAARGALTLMVGGNPEVVQACDDVLAALGARRFYCGPLGSGAALKLVNNLVSCGTSVLVAEALAIGARAGLSPQVMVEVMSSTAADNWHLRNTYPTRVMQGDFSPYFKLALAHKDLGLATATAAALGVPSLMGNAAHQIYTFGLGAGLGDEDQSACIKVFEACTRVPVRTSSQPPEADA